MKPIESLAERDEYFQLYSEVRKLGERMTWPSMAAGVLLTWALVEALGGGAWMVMLATVNTGTNIIILFSNWYGRRLWKVLDAFDRKHPGADRNDPSL